MNKQTDLCYLHQQDEALSLYQVFAIIVKYKKRFLAVFIVSLSLLATWVSLSPARYLFLQTIDLPLSSQGLSDVQPLMSPENVRWYINNLIKPRLDNNIKIMINDTDKNTERGTGRLNLGLISTDKNRKQVNSILTLIKRDLTAEERSIMNKRGKLLQNQIHSLKARLDLFDMQKKVLQKQLATQQSSPQLAMEIVNIMSNIDDAQKSLEAVKLAQTNVTPLKFGTLTVLSLKQSKLVTKYFFVGCASLCLALFVVWLSHFLAGFCQYVREKVD